VENSDVVANGTLDRLIRENLVTGTMATSLMNDNTYTYDVSIKLLEMSDTLFATRDAKLRELEQSIRLDEDELENMAFEAE